MTTFPSSTTRQRLQQELRLRWQQGERQALRNVLDSVPPEHRAEVFKTLLPEELKLRREYGEKTDLETLQAIFPDAASFLENQAEDPTTIRLGVSGDWFAQSASWAERVDWPSSLERFGKPHLPQEVSAQAGRWQDVPREIDHYELLQELGRGGMGVVWKALDHQLKRVVAVKMLLAGPFSDPVDRSRFRREAQVLAQVQHPHLVQVFGFGEHNGVPYLVMEYVDGISLWEYARRRPIDPHVAAYFVEKIARAVQVVHEQGIIHRDLKPGNILLGRAGGSSTSELPHPQGRTPIRDLNPYTLVPKLTDFGLAKRLQGQTVATTAGEVLGTLHYMAPEQAKGDSGQIGPAADVYGLGAVLYELVTGMPPVSGGNLVEIMASVQSRDPVAPTQLNPNLPRDLATICLKCLEKEPARRYPSAAALADDLRRFLRREPISARPVSEWGKIWRWCRRNPLLASLSAALMLSLVALVVVYAWQLAKTRSAYAELAERNEQLSLARDQAHQARQAVEQQRDQLQRAAARTTFLKAVELAEQGDPTIALFKMEQALRQALPDMTDFRRVVLTCMAGWSQYVPEVIDCRDLGEDWFYKVDRDGRHAWIWSKPDGTVDRFYIPTMQIVGPSLRLPEGSRPLSMSVSRRWLACRISNPPSIEVFDTTSGKLAASILHPGSQLGEVAVRDDGSRLASLDSDGRIRVWELPSGKLLAGPIFTGARRFYSAKVEFGPDGDLIVSEGGGTGLILDGEQFKPQLLPAGETALALLPRRRVLTQRIDNANRLNLYDLGTRRLLAEITSPAGVFLGGATSENGAGDTLIAGVPGELLVFWDMYKSQLCYAPLRVLEMSSFNLDPDLRLLATRWQRLRLPRPVSAMVRPSSHLEINIGQFRQPTFWCRAIVNPEAGWAATVQKKPTGEGLLLRFVDHRTSSPLGQTVLLNGNQALGMAASTDGKKVAVTSYQTGLLAGWVQVVSAPSGEALLPPLEHTNYPTGAAFSPDGRFLAVGDYNRQVLIWDLTSGKLALPPIHETDIITALAWSPDGRYLAVGTTLDYSKQPHVRLWDVVSGRPLFDPVLTEQPVDLLMFSPDAAVVVATTKEKAWIIDVATGQLRSPPATIKPLNTAGISPDGQLLALGSGSGAVAVLQVRNGQLLTVVDGRSAVTAVAFSSDGQTLAVACNDGTVRLIDLATQLPLGPPFVHANSVVEVRCEAKNQALVVATADGHVYRWPWPHFPNLADADLLCLLKVFTGLKLEETGPRVLTPEEWRKCYLSLPMSIAHNPFGSRIKDKDWYEWRAREAEIENRPEQAIYYLDRLLALQPDDPHLILRRARNEFLLDDRLSAELEAKRAAWLLERLGSAAPFDAEKWHTHEMALHCFHGRRESALWHADWLRENARNYSSLWQAAIFYRLIGLRPLAAACEQKALTTGLPPHLKYELALRYAEEANWDQAKSLLQQAMAESAPPLLITSRVAVVLARLGLAAPTPPWLENLVEAAEKRALGGWVRTHVWTLITLPCPSEWRQRALACVEALRPPSSEPLATAYDTAAGALLIRLGQPQVGAARIQAALPGLDARAKPAALAMLAIAAVSQDDLASARHYYEEARGSLQAIDSYWIKAGAELLLEEVKQRLAAR